MTQGNEIPLRGVGSANFKEMLKGIYEPPTLGYSATIVPGESYGNCESKALIVEDKLDIER